MSGAAGLGPVASPYGAAVAAPSLRAKRGSAAARAAEMAASADIAALLRRSKQTSPSLPELPDSTVSARSHRTGEGASGASVPRKRHGGAGRRPNDAVHRRGKAKPRIKVNAPAVSAVDNATFRRLQAQREVKNAARARRQRINKRRAARETEATLQAAESQAARVAQVLAGRGQLPLELTPADALQLWQTLPAGAPDGAMPPPPTLSNVVMASGGDRYSSRIPSMDLVDLAEQRVRQRPGPRVSAQNGDPFVDGGAAGRNRKARSTSTKHKQHGAGRGLRVIHMDEEGKTASHDQHQQHQQQQHERRGKGILLLDPLAMMMGGGGGGGDDDTEAISARGDDMGAMLTGDRPRAPLSSAENHRQTSDDAGAIEHWGFVMGGDEIVATSGSGGGEMAAWEYNEVQNGYDDEDAMALDAAELAAIEAMEAMGVSGLGNLTSILEEDEEDEEDELSMAASARSRRRSTRVPRTSAAAALRQRSRRRSSERSSASGGNRRQAPNLGLMLDPMEMALPAEHDETKTNEGLSSASDSSQKLELGARDRAVELQRAAQRGRFPHPVVADEVAHGGGGIGNAVREAAVRALNEDDAHRPRRTDAIRVIRATTGRKEAGRNATAALGHSSKSDTDQAAIDAEQARVDMTGAEHDMTGAEHDMTGAGHETTWAERRPSSAPAREAPPRQLPPLNTNSSALGMALQSGPATHRPSTTSQPILTLMNDGLSSAASRQVGGSTPMLPPQQQGQQDSDVRFQEQGEMTFAIQDTRSDPGRAAESSMVVGQDGVLLTDPTDLASLGSSAQAPAAVSVANSDLVMIDAALARRIKAGASRRRRGPDGVALPGKVSHGPAKSPFMPGGARPHLDSKGTRNTHHARKSGSGGLGIDAARRSLDRLAQATSTSPGTGHQVTVSGQQGTNRRLPKHLRGAAASRAVDEEVRSNAVLAAGRVEARLGVQAGSLSGMMGAGLTGDMRPIGARGRDTSSAASASSSLPAAIQQRQQQHQATNDDSGAFLTLMGSDMGLSHVDVDADRVRRQEQELKARQLAADTASAASATIEQGGISRPDGLASQHGDGYIAADHSDHAAAQSDDTSTHDHHHIRATAGSNPAARLRTPLSKLRRDTDALVLASASKHVPQSSPPRSNPKRTTVGPLSNLTQQQQNQQTRSPPGAQRHDQQRKVRHGTALLGRGLMDRGRGGRGTRRAADAPHGSVSGGLASELAGGAVVAAMAARFGLSQAEMDEIVAEAAAEEDVDDVEALQQAFRSPQHPTGKQRRAVDTEIGQAGDSGKRVRAMAAKAAVATAGSPHGQNPVTPNLSAQAGTIGMHSKDAGAGQGSKLPEAHRARVVRDDEADTDSSSSLQQPTTDGRQQGEEDEQEDEQEEEEEEAVFTESRSRAVLNLDVTAHHDDNGSNVNLPPDNDDYAAAAAAADDDDDDDAGSIESRGSAPQPNAMAVSSMPSRPQNHLLRQSSAANPEADTEASVQGEAPASHAGEIRTGRLPLAPVRTPQHKHATLSGGTDSDANASLGFPDAPPSGLDADDSGSVAASSAGDLGSPERLLELAEKRTFDRIGRDVPTLPTDQAQPITGLSDDLIKPIAAHPSDASDHSFELRSNDGSPRLQSRLDLRAEQNAAAQLAEEDLAEAESRAEQGQMRQGRATVAGAIGEGVAPSSSIAKPGAHSSASMAAAAAVATSGAHGRQPIRITGGGRATSAAAMNRSIQLGFDSLPAMGGSPAPVSGAGSDGAGSGFTDPPVSRAAAVSSTLAVAATRAAISSTAIVQDVSREQHRAHIEHESAVRSTSRELADNALAEAVQATAEHGIAGQATTNHGIAGQATDEHATAVQATDEHATAVQATAEHATAVQATDEHATAVQATTGHGIAVQPTAEQQPPASALESLEQRYGRVGTGGKGQMVIDLL